MSEPIVDHAGKPMGNGLDIGGKGLHLRATGPLAIMALSFILMGGLLGWINYRGFEDVKALLVRSSLDHSTLTSSQDYLTCTISLSPEERTLVRRQGTRDVFYSFCPWMRRPDTRGDYP